MRSRFSASAISSSSASPRVPTSEKACSRCPSAKSSQAAIELALVLLAALAVQPPPGGVELQERVLDEVPRAHGVDYRSRSEAVASASRRRIQCAPCGSRCSRRTRGPTRVVSRATSRRSPRELAAAGHEPRILAPFDPDDALSARLHRGARPQRRPVPEGFVSLGRTVGMPANGAVSNMALTPHARAQRCAASCATAATTSRTSTSRSCRCSAGTRSARPASCRSSAPSTPTPRTSLTNGIAAVPLGGRRRMNRLHVRIAVSEAAAWTARRFYGGRYRIIPNGVHLPAGDRRRRGAVERPSASRASCGSCSSARPSNARACRCCCARSRRCASTSRRRSRSSAPAAEEVAHMMLDGPRRAARSARSPRSASCASSRAPTCCARPRCSGESFGMVLTEAFAAATPVLASDIPGYRDVVRDGVDGHARARPATRSRSPRRCAALALDPRGARGWRAAARERAERFAWPHVAAEVLDCYEQAIATARRARRPARGRLARGAVRHGLAPADLLPRDPRPAPAEPADAPPARPARRPATAAPAHAAPRRRSLRSSLLGVGPRRAGAAARRRRPRGRLARRLQARPARRRPRADVRGDVRPRDRLARDPRRRRPTWRRAKRRDAMQGTFIGVLMSSTLPARLGEPSRALIVARRLGRARETLPVVLGTMVSQTLLNLLALTHPRRRDAVERQRARRPRPRAAAARARAAGGAARRARSRRC